MNKITRNGLKELKLALQSRSVQLGVHKDKIESDIVNASTPHSGYKEVEALDDQGNPVAAVEFANLRYTAEIYIEHLPNKSVPLLILLLMSVLSDDHEHRDQYGLGDPAITFVSEDAKHTDVMIEVDFLDIFYMMPDPQGDVPWNGGNYRLGSYDLYIAESGTVEHAAT